MDCSTMLIKTYDLKQNADNKKQKWIEMFSEIVYLQ